MARSLELSSGRTLVVDEQGQGSQTLVCLHGLGGGGYFFQDLASALSGSTRVISLDLPSWRDNRDGAEAFSIETCVAVIADLIREEIDGPVVLLGHSMGTIVALKLFERLGERIAGMIFLGGLPEPVAEMRSKLSNRIEEVREHGLEAVSGEAMKGIFARKSLDEKREIVESFRLKFASNDASAYMTSAQALIDASAADAVAKVSVPCLAITGAEDLYASPENVGAFAESLPVDTECLVFENCGHMIFYEAPEQLAEEVSKFLDSLSRGSFSKP